MKKEFFVVGVENHYLAEKVYKFVKAENPEKAISTFNSKSEVACCRVSVYDNANDYHKQKKPIKSWEYTAESNNEYAFQFHDKKKAKKIFYIVVKWLGGKSREDCYLIDKKKLQITFYNADVACGRGCYEVRSLSLKEHFWDKSYVKTENDYVISFNDEIVKSINGKRPGLVVPNSD